ncbi:helix-turn-helix domain-containing protein [Streptomyces sp. NPDC021749]|uniref:helix-turn-helix domain-containing protein n=1 Tax=Streptomyces sp. NPDC021749 TaxID=3154905 RepID=UPI003406E000
MPSEDELFAAVDALLEGEPEMPPPAERARLRDAAGVSQARLAQVLQTSTQTIKNWEAGRSEPRPPRRQAYQRLLDGWANKYPKPGDAAAHGPGEPGRHAGPVRPGGLHPAAAPAAPTAPEPVAPTFAAQETAQTAWGPNGLAVQGEWGPCIRCGVPTPYQSTDGRPLHAGAMCQPPAAATASQAAQPASTPAPAAPASPVPAPVPTRPQRRAKSAARAQAETHAMITQAVHEELERAEGDTEAALASLIKRAIPDVMAMFEETRATARYKFTAYPALPDILKKPSKREPDQIWEARPNFHHPDFSFKIPGSIQVTALDANAAYLSALKCWLPIGKLEHTTGGDGVDPKRSGVHLITPAEWRHPHLPNPLGDRDTDGALWVTDATLRLLIRLSTPKYGLIEAPEIHESWTSGATENFLDALRKILTAAREKAIAEEDTITTEYVKAMYSKFVSTMGESMYNREIVRPDWMHIIHSQAYANLWGKAYKAHQAGLEIIAMMGTDELHVTGDWRNVFSEGRGVAQMKIKYSDAKASGEYTIGKVTH